MSLTLETFGSVTEKNLVSLIRVAQSSSRYCDMCKFVKKLILHKTLNNKELTYEQLTLFSTAYKNLITPKRSNLTLFTSGFDDIDELLSSKYQTIIQNELEIIYNEVKYFNKLILYDKYIICFIGY